MIAFDYNEKHFDRSLTNNYNHITMLPCILHKHLVKNVIPSYTKAQTYCTQISNLGHTLIYLFGIIYLIYVIIFK